MSYSTFESALKTLLVSVSGFSTANVAVADDKILARGPTQALVLRYGGFSQEEIADRGAMLKSWTILGKLYVKHVNDMQVHDDSVSVRQNIIDKTDQYPTLNLGPDVVFDAMVMQADFPGESIVVGGSKYQVEQLHWRVREEVDVNWQEAI